MLNSVLDYVKEGVNNLSSYFWKTSYSYEKSKQIIQSDDTVKKLKLAENLDTKPEILYFLTEDRNQEVRQAVAQNQSTPLQADMLLACDVDEETRICIIKKISSIIPTLKERDQEQFGKLFLQILKVLVDDHLPRVRAILSEELSSLSYVPKEIVDILSNDPEILVSGPILQHSPLLTQEDLISIISNVPTDNEMFKFIAERSSVQPSVADAIVMTKNVNGITALLENSGAQIREETLNCIVDMAEHIEAWHKPLVMRKEIPVYLVHRISQFITSALFNILLEREDLDAETIKDLSILMEKRLSEETHKTTDDTVPFQPLSGVQLSSDDAHLSLAIDNEDRATVTKILANRTNIDINKIQDAIRSRRPDTIISLCWKANISMKTAIRIQVRIANLSRDLVISAHNGTTFPFSEKKMVKILENLS